MASRGRPSLERAAAIGNLVVEAAITAFVEKGLDISIEQIAQSVGVSKQAVYRRWSSKILLLMDVMDRVMAQVHANLIHDLPDDALLALKELSRRMCQPDGGVRERSMTILMAEALGDAAVRHWLGSWRDQHFAFYRRYVTAVRPADRSGTVARILFAIVEGVSREAYWQDLSDAECAGLFLRKWDACLPLLDG
jgi:AcrR family transcriptional regulator